MKKLSAFNFQFSAKEGYLFKDSFNVLTVLANKRINSLQSLCMDSYSASERYEPSFRSINQYSVSLISFKATFILFRKSALDWAC